MKIDNEPIAAKVRLIYMGIPLIIVIVTGALYLVANSREIKWLLFGVAFLVLFFIFMAILKYNYIMLFVGPEKVVFHYKSLSPLKTANNSIEIKATEFAGYEITNSLGGIRRNIVLFKNTPGGKAKFPSVCINLVSDEKLTKLKQAFDLVILLQNKKD